MIQTLNRISHHIGYTVYRIFRTNCYNLVTNLGKFLDPIADKVLVSSALIVILTVPSYFTAFLGGWAMIVGGCCVVVIFARELIVSGFRMVAADAGIVIAADKIGKFKTFLV